MSALLDELKEKNIVNIDYVGFTFNGIHSSQLNILSVSDGSRYHNDLLPPIEDYSIDIVGGYGANYFGGTFKKREFTLNIAYDNVTEELWRAMREWLSDRETHELYFDENPYKVYHAVVSKTPNFKYLAFGNVGTRIYKGEGTIVFTCYNPIAYSLNGNYLENYESENLEEWAVASGMLDSKDKYENGQKINNYYDTPVLSEGKYIIHAYNAGTLPAPFRMYLHWTGSILQIKNNTTNKFLKISGSSGTDEALLIDTERSVILELEKENNQAKRNNGEVIETTVVLNNLIEDGRFFLLVPGENELEINGANFISKVIVDNQPQDNGFIFYHRYI